MNDLDPVISGIWKFLIDAGKRKGKPILEIPIVSSVEDLKGFSKAAKDLVGFWFTKATPVPAKQKVGWARGGKYSVQYWSEGRRRRLAEQAEKIRHWEILEGSYEDLDNKTATWFVDPPYQGLAGRAYVKDEIDYECLGEWCRRRRGEVIVCENEGADWLLFDKLGDFKTSRKGKSAEMICHIVDGRKRLCSS